MSITNVIQRDVAVSRLFQNQGEAQNRDSKSWRVGCGQPVQLGPTLAALFCDIQLEDGPDNTGGCRIVLFDDLDRIGHGENIALSQNNEIIGDPASGQARMAMKGGAWVWFVPEGARRADGSPHPHAGTGFGVGGILLLPVRKDLTLERSAFYNAEHRKIIYQFEFGRSGFRIASERQYCLDDLPVVPTVPITEQMLAVRARDVFRWRLSGPGLGAGVADGDGMLMPAMAVSARPGATGEKSSSIAAGVMRWEVSTDGVWQPVSFTPIAISVGEGGELGWEQTWMEPCLVRTPDGALLFSARPLFGANEHSIRLWRSMDGLAWQVVFDALEVRAESPVSINTALDGSPYFAFNPWSPDYATKAYTHGRRLLEIRPMRPDLHDWDEGLLVRSAPDSEYSKWFFDHPRSANIRLKDGKWRHVLTYRSFFCGEPAELDKTSLRYGVYLDVVESNGLEFGTWKFL